MNPRDIDPSAMPPDDPVLAHLRVPPHSIEAECSVLGGLLLDNGLWDCCAGVLTTEDFYRHENRLAFGAIAALVAAGKPADVVTVFDQLQRAGQSGESGGLSYLNDLAQFVPSAGNLRRYAEIVRERAVLRRLIAAGNEIAASASDPKGADATALLERSLVSLQALQARGALSRPQPVGALASALCERVQALHDGSIEPGISTGIGSIDKRLNGGFRGGKLIILAARPAVGKSSLAMQIAIHMAGAGHGVGFFSLEMPSADLSERVCANVGRILLDGIVTGRLRESEWPRLTDAAQRMQRLPLYLDDQPALTLTDIQAKARALVRERGINLLVLDYIQLCGTRKTEEKRHHQIEEISRGLKTLAKQLDITILALSQLSRVSDSRVGGKPQLSDLKESGAIEEDADVVMLLSMDHVGEHGQKVIEADFAKNRQGRVGSVALSFDGGFQSWCDSGEPLSKPSAGRPRGAAYASNTFEF
jgi:replicative DNA helicase